MSIVIESGNINGYSFSIRLDNVNKAYRAIVTDNNNVVVLNRHYMTIKSARQAIKRIIERG